MSEVKTKTENIIFKGFVFIFGILYPIFLMAHYPLGGWNLVRLRIIEEPVVTIIGISCTLLSIIIFIKETKKGFERGEISWKIIIEAIFGSF